MPVRYPCIEPGCPNLTDRGGRCPEHQKASNRFRGTKLQRGYDQFYKRLRVQCFERDHWRCIDCGWQPPSVCIYQRTGMPTLPPAERILAELRSLYVHGQRHLHADHEIPIAVRPELRLSLDNLRTRCNQCHMRKTRRESAYGVLADRSADTLMPGRELIVLMGAPGSGKSTYAELFAHVVSTDELRMMEAKPGRAAVTDTLDRAYTAIKLHLEHDHTVVFDTTAAHPLTRRRALDVAHRCKAKATLVVFDTPVAECVARQTHRKYPVDSKVVERVHSEIARQRDALKLEGWDMVTVRDCASHVLSVV